MHASNASEAYPRSWRHLVDRHGEKIGKLDELFVDEATEKPERATVHTGLIGSRPAFVPLVGPEPVSRT
jgi:hypothetical protein